MGAPQTSSSSRLLLRMREVAELIGCSRSKTYELAATGAIPTIRLGGLLRVPAEALRKLIERNPSAKRSGLELIDCHPRLTKPREKNVALIADPKA
jgi:excisionase family DNA binding protein